MTNCLSFFKHSQISYQCTVYTSTKISQPTNPNCITYFPTAFPTLGVTGAQPLVPCKLLHKVIVIVRTIT